MNPFPLSFTSDFANWAVARHRDTNHYYDKYLPYEFHLRMVVQVGRDFFHLLPTEPYYKYDAIRVNDEEEYAWSPIIQAALWGHDLIEDTRTSYRDIKDRSNRLVADLIYALTDEKGKNREERHGGSYYEGLRTTKGAVFCKLCDRIANVQYSKLTKSRMTDMYKKENENFKRELYDEHLKPMFEYLDALFTEL